MLLWHTVNELRDKGAINIATNYALKSDKMVLDKLAEHTLGDPDAYTDVTLQNIICEIEAEAEQRGMEKEREINYKRQSEMSEQFGKIIDEVSSKVNVVQNDMINHLSGLRIEIDERLRIINRDINHTEESTDKFRRVYRWVIGILGLIIIVSSIVIGLKQDKVLAILVTAVPTTLWLLGWILNKELKLKGIEDEFSMMWKMRRLSKYNCSLEEKELLQKRRDEIDIKMKKYQDDLVNDPARLNG